MKKIIAALAVSALAFAAGTAGAKPTTFSQKGEARLAKMLEGRVPGKPVSCITTMGPSDDLQTITGAAIVYKDGKTIYVARPTDPRQLGPSDVLVIKRTSASQLCTNDILYTVDQGTGFRNGAVFLQNFVPYTKP